MIRKCMAAAAWLCLIGLCVVTLAPIGMRPEVTAPQFERFVAFVILGFLFGAAYPRHLPIVLAVVIGSAIILELLQSMTADRHARVIDMVAKASGGLFGFVVAAVSQRVFERS